MNWRAAWSHARVARRAGDHEAAARAFAAALDGLTGNAEPTAVAELSLEYAVLLSERAHPDARSRLERAIERAEAILGPEHAALTSALLALGVEHATDDDPAQARALLQRAIAVADNSVARRRALDTYANFAWRQSDLTEAAGALRQSARIATRTDARAAIESYRRAAVVYVHAGMLGDAIQALQEARRSAASASEDAALLLEQAEVLDRAGRVVESMHCLQEAAARLEAADQLDETLAITLEDLAERLARLGRHDEVHGVATRALQVRLALFPDTPAQLAPTHLAYARCLMLRGDTAGSQGELAWAMARIDGDESPRWLTLGDAAESLATTIDPTKARHALRTLTWLLERSDDPAGRTQVRDRLHASLNTALPGWVAGGLGAVVAAGETSDRWEEVAVQLLTLLRAARPYSRFLNTFGSSLHALPVSARQHAARRLPKAFAAYDALDPCCVGLTTLLTADPSSLDRAHASQLRQILTDSIVRHPSLPPLRDLLSTVDDPDVVILHPSLERGFQVRMTRVLHVQQLLVLLADALCGPRVADLPGERPPDEDVGRASGTEPVPPSATVAPVWRAFSWSALTFEGFLDERHSLDADTRIHTMPKLSGRRVILLHEGGARSWVEQLAVPRIAASVERVHALHGEEVSRWLSRVRDARKTQDFAIVEGHRLTAEALGRGQIGDPEGQHQLLAQALNLHKRLVHRLDATSLPIIEALAEVSLELGDAPAAVALRTQAFDLVGRLHGPTSPEAVRAQVAWADAAIATGEAQRAHRVLQNTMRLAMAHPGPEHIALIDTHGGSARVCRALGRFEEGITHQEQAASLVGATGDAERHGAEMAALARMQAAGGRIVEAASSALFALGAYRGAYGEWHPLVADAYDLVAERLEAAEDTEQALEARIRARSIRSADVYDANEAGVRALAERVRRLLLTDRPEAAADLGLHGLPAMVSVHGSNGPPTRALRELVLRGLHAVERTDDAVAVAQEAVQAAEDHDDLAVLGEALCNLGDLLTAAGHPQDAVAPLVRAVEAAGQAGADPIQAAANLRLGTCYASLDRFAEAEAVLRHALDWQMVSGADEELTEWTQDQIDAVRDQRARREA
jgi:tetratricopeptide (TPR) repeat protein